MTMFLLQSLGLLMVRVSCFHLTDSINDLPSKIIRQESITSSPVPSTTYVFPGPAPIQPTMTGFSILVESPVVVAPGQSVTSVSILVTVLNQFPSWFCGLEYVPVTSDPAAGTYWTWGTLPYVCQSGGRLTSGGQAADGYVCSLTRLSTSGSQYPCCASAGSCALPFTTCITSHCNINYDVGCWGSQPTATITDPRAITCSTCLTIDIGGISTFDCYTDASTGLYYYYTDPITSVSVVNRAVLTTVFLGQKPTFTNSDTSSNKWTLAYPISFPMLPQATGPDVVTDLSSIRSSDVVPSCVNSMAASCPSLYSVVLNTSNAFEAAYFICSGVLNSSCPELCSEKVESLEWLNWVLGVCSEYPFFSKKAWSDYPELQSAAYNFLLPWNWRVQSTDPTYRCPSNSEKLASFAVVNVIMSVCNLILGRRTVVERLTFKKWGKKYSPPFFWVLSALFSVSLTLLANFINALLVKRTPGFEEVPLAALALFWFTRPRLGWMATALVSIERDNEQYTSLAATSLAAEVILQAVGAFYIGTTAAYCIRYSLLSTGTLSNINHSLYVELMYAGSLIWLGSLWVFYGRVIWTYTGIRKAFKPILNFLSRICCGFSACCRWVLCYCGHRESSLMPSFNIHPDRQLGLGAKLETLTYMFAYMFMPFVGQWLFWVGFIGVAGNEFCPPPIWKMAGVWSGFGALGVFFGASH